MVIVVFVGVCGDICISIKTIALVQVSDVSGYNTYFHVQPLFVDIESLC